MTSTFEEKIIGQTIAHHTFMLLPVAGNLHDAKPFYMGRSDDDPIEEDLENNQKPIHPVRLADFHMGKYPVTQALWQAVIEADCPPFERLGLAKLDPNPSRFKGDLHPVEQVSWDDVQIFLRKLNLLTETQRPAGSQYRLPSEAEWEYAARGGKYGEGYRYAGSDKLSEVAWFEENSEGETHEAGILMPNELGLFDMSGNVWEWCEDWYTQDFYRQCLVKGEVKNPKGPEEGSFCVLRGGSWVSTAKSCRACYRFGGVPDARRSTNGFRLVLAPQSVG